MRYIPLIIALFMIGCTSPAPKKADIKPYFDITSFTENLILNQSQSGLPVSKKLWVNGVKEEVEVKNTDSLFWATELYPLLIAEINKPSLLGAFDIQEKVEEQNSNLLKTIYTALPDANTTVKKIEIKYLNNPKELRQIVAQLKTENHVYKTTQNIHVWLNDYNGLLLIDSLKTTGINKTIFLDTMHYASSVINRGYLK